MVGNNSSSSFRNLLSDARNVYTDWGFFFRAYDKRTGSLRWNTDYTNDGREFSGLGGPRISQDGAFLYLPRRGKVLKVDKLSGNIVMEFPLDRLIPEPLTQGATDPVPSFYGDNLLYIPTVYFDTVNTPAMVKGNIFAFNRTTGELAWEFKAPTKVQPTNEFEATDSLLIESSIFDIAIFEDYLVAASGPTILLLDRFNGEILWHKPIKDRRFLGRPGEGNSFGSVQVGLAVDENGIYLVTLDGTARKLDWQTGQELWSVNITFSNISIPTVLDGMLYFNNNLGGGIWVIDTETGAVLFNSRPPGYSGNPNDVYISSLGVGSGYMVNVGSLRVYCLFASTIND